MEPKKFLFYPGIKFSFLIFSFFLFIDSNSQCVYDFSYTNSGNTVQFDNFPDLSLTGGNGIIWVVDGVQQANINDPSLTLSNGAHYVCMTLVDMSCMPNPTIQVCDSVYVGNPPCVYEFDYTVNNNTVYFDNTPNLTLSGGNGIVWNVDGVQMANTNDPVLTLSNGAHYVCMTLVDMGCMPNPTIQFCDSVYVQDPNCFGLPYETAFAVPDSVTGLPLSGSFQNYTNTGLLNHNGSGFTNTPVWVSNGGTQHSNALFFHDFDFAIPSVATITGIEIFHTHGGMNSNTYAIDSIYIMNNGVIVGTAKRDSTASFQTDTLGADGDVWNTSLNAADINGSDFGFYLFTTMIGSGGTYGQFDFRAKIYYCSTIAPVSVMENQRNSLRIFPNPFLDMLQIESEEIIQGTVTITDISGRIFFTQEANSKNLIINTSNMIPGIYIVHAANKIYKLIKTN